MKNNINMTDIEKAKEKIVKDSKKGFSYFLKNAALIVLIIIAFYIIGNFQELIKDPKTTLDLFLTNGWEVFGTMIIVVFGIYQLARNLSFTDASEHFNETISTYQAAEADLQKQKEIAHKNAVNKRFENSPIIDNILKDLLIDLDADRACIAEMHNGTNNLNGLPFVFFDVTYEATSPSVKYVSDEFKNFNMGKFPFIAKHFIDGTFIGPLTDIEKEDPRLASIFKFADAYYGAAIVIEGVDGPFGFLTVTFNDKEEYPSKTKIMQKINKAAQVISTLLDK